MRPPSTTLRRALLGAALLAILAGLACAALGVAALAARDPVFLGERLRRIAQLATFTAPLNLADRIPAVVTVSRILLTLGYTLTVLWALLVFNRSLLDRLAASRLRGHVVVCGPRAVHGATNESVVRLHQSPNPASDPPGTIQLVGDPATRRDLERAGVAHASTVLFLGDDTEHNLRAAAVLESLAETRDSESPRVVVEVGDDSVRLGLGAMRVNAVETVDREIFFRERAVARALLQDHPLIDPTIGHRRLQVLIVGITPIATQLVLELIRSGVNHERGPRILFLDADPQRHVEELRDRYPAIDSVCELEPVALDPARIRASMARALDASTAADGADPARPLHGVFICHERPQRSIGLLAALRTEALARDISLPSAFIHGRRHHTLLTTLAAVRDETDGKLIPFGDDARAYRYEELAGDRRDRLARAIHERYLVTLRDIGSTGGERPADRPWNRLATSYRDANRHQADHIEVKLRSIGCVSSDAPNEPFEFTEAEVERLARMEHTRWMAERLLDGWRAGTARDDTKRVHSSIRPYDALPAAEQELDREAVRGIPEILAAVGRGLSRVR